MYDLAARDHAAMLDLVAAILDSPAPEAAWALTTTELNRHLRGTVALFLQAHPGLPLTEGGGRVAAWVPSELGALRLNDRQREYGAAHPLAQLHAAGDHTPRTVNDVIDEASWRRSPAYRITREEFDGAVRQLALPLIGPADVFRGVFIIGRPGMDFGPRERAFSQRMQPLLTRLDAHLRELQRLRSLASAADTAGAVKRAAGAGITPRELTVLALMADGLTAVAIAARLAISPHTVTKHQENLYRKLGTRDRLTTVLVARDAGLVPHQHRHPDWATRQTVPHIRAIGVTRRTTQDRGT